MIRFSMLVVNNNRSKAYLQNLVKNNFIPSKIIVLDDSNVRLPEHTDNDKIFSHDTKQKLIRRLDKLKIEFDEKEHIITTINNNNIKYTLLDTLDVNSKLVVEEVKKLKEDYIIYSGPGGTILKKDILNQNKKFIHVHPGKLPKHRGSTTLYYSYLINSKVGASVILMNDKIDEGPILYTENYLIQEKDFDFDYELDPLIRAKALINCFSKNNLSKKNQSNGESFTFYIIHPFLKHSAILFKKWQI